MSGRALGAEFLGTAFLLVAIVGSGINAAVDGAASAQLFQHAVIVGAALFALILTFGPTSGAHLNPAVTVVDAAFGGLEVQEAAGYVVAQTAGAFVGVVVANATFGRALVSVSEADRGGLVLASGEALATFGLLVVIFGIVRSGNTRAVPSAVGAYIAAAIYFTSSASFANPAVTVARSLSDTYTGITPGAIPGFLVAQAFGAALAAGVIRWLFAPAPDVAERVVVPHQDDHPPLPTSANGG